MTATRVAACAGPCTPARERWLSLISKPLVILSKRREGEGGGAQSKDPVECKTDARTSLLLIRDASTPFRPRLRPRRNSAQHDPDIEIKLSHYPPARPLALAGIRVKYPRD